MRFIGDFHIHSHYSRATSKQLVPEMLDLWGQRKGIKVLGTGDFTHPGWTAELSEKLEPAEEGLFVLKKKFSGDRGTKGTRFLLTAEISSIYKFGEKVRKVHNLIFAPGFKAVQRIQEKIEALGGNIRSDGRPILGLDSRDLLELCLEADERTLFIPAHIWTPWFSSLGSKSGFDTIEECYRDLSDHILAVETGLSSDPPMNWMCSFLDKYTIISNSDAHSPEKLGREANLFDAELSYTAITDALSKGASSGFRGTVEFFPQEGKYHHDGHRKCGISWDPLTTLRHGGICPVCGRPVTVGVLNRVAQLADRIDIYERPGRDPFYSLIPLKEILAELEGVGSGSKRVGERYEKCLARLGPELDILLYRDSESIRHVGGGDLAFAIERMRERKVHAEAGYDGEYGRIRVWGDEEKIPDEDGETDLFETGDTETVASVKTVNFLEFDLAEFQELKTADRSAKTPDLDIEPPGAGALDLNEDQRRAVAHRGAPSLIIAGPGTGKTRTVVEKICFLTNEGVSPHSIIAVTFANRAAGELRKRLDEADAETKGVRVSTFHSFGLSILKANLDLLDRNEHFLILDDQEKEQLVKENTDLGKSDRAKMIDYSSRVKNGLEPVPGPTGDPYKLFRLYQGILKKRNAFDYDDLVYLPVRLFGKLPSLLKEWQEGITHLIVDEYQDINPMQYTLLRILAEKAELCVVGDPNQSIYSFRGGSPEFIRRFAEDYPESVTFPLCTSYRCPGTLLKASSQVLGGEGGFLSGLKEGVRVRIHKTATAASEAEQIARDIEEKAGGVGFFSFDSEVTGTAGTGDVAFSDIAVLCRTSLQLSPIEKAFKDHRIPFRTIRQDHLFREDPYRGFLDFIRLLLDPETASFLRPAGVTSRQVLTGLTPPENLAEALQLFTDCCPATADPRIINDMQVELCRFWGDRGSPEEFVENARLGSGLDRYDPRIQAVTLMTIHASKGLEFEWVYIPGCENSIIPCTLTKEEYQDEEEERRLLYVAMTRAKQEVVLSMAAKRVIFGKVRTQNESPFLASIEQELLDRREIEYNQDRVKPDDQLMLFE